MLGVLKLIFYYQKKSYVSLLLSLLLPFLFLFLITSFCSTITQPLSKNGPFLGLPGVIILIGVTIGILHLTLFVNDIKQTMFFKRIKAMPLSIAEFFYGIFIYHLLLILIITILIFAIATGIYYDYILFSWINWTILFLAIITNSIVCCLLGFSISFLIEDSKKSLALSIILYLLILFLSGCFLPLLIIKISIILKICSYCLITSFVTALLIYGWYFFPWEVNHHKIVTFADYDIVNNWWVPVIVIIVFIFSLMLINIYYVQIKLLVSILFRSRRQKKWKIEN